MSLVDLDVPCLGLGICGCRKCLKKCSWRTLIWFCQFVITLGKRFGMAGRKKAKYKNSDMDSTGVEKPRCKYHPGQHFSLSK